MNIHCFPLKDLKLDLWQVKKGKNLDVTVVKKLKIQGL